MQKRAVLLSILALLVASCQQPASSDIPQSTESHDMLTELPRATVDPTPMITASAEDVDRVNVTTSGIIGRDEIWRDEIHLTGDIGFANGAVLTIEPGTVVYFASNSDDRSANDTDGCFDDYTCEADDPTLRPGWGASAILLDGRGGTINAIGTPEMPIIFRPEGDSSSTGQYDGIFIEQGTLKHAKLLYGSGVQALGGFGSIEIAYVEVRHSLIAAIDVHTNDVWVHHNTVEGGGHHAIGVHRDGAIIEHNIVSRCQTGINLHEQSNVVVRNNIIVDCANGVSVNGSNTSVENNTIVSIAGPPEGWFYQDELVYPAFSQGAGIIGSSNGPDRIVNNIIYGPFQWAIAYHGQAPIEGAQVEFNLYWETVEAFGGPGQTVIGLNNSNLDPLFVDPEAGDFSLAAGSPAMDAGSPDLLDEDGTASDLGAYGGPRGSQW